MHGKVRWFNNGKCYGRVSGEDGNEYHVHFSQISPHGTGFKSLNPGETVEFTPVASGFRNKNAEAKRVVRSVQLPVVLAGSVSASTGSLDVVDIKVDALGRVYLPKREEDDPRDYAVGNVRAFFVGHPGSIREKTRIAIAVDLPESEKKNVVILPVEFNGGIMTRGTWSYDFPRGGFVLVVKIDGNSCTATAKKISVRTQDSRSVVHPNDMGEWVVVEIPFSQELAIPAEYTDAEDLAGKIWSQIPEEFPGNPQANFTKFARAIAHAIVSSKNPS
ncbi:MAG: cold shock domain-containing protein [bacterium]|nr:cold shock domain-containing protein [bacterium]